ncbi:SMI1/KNR4 family protein [Cerasicoccus maritimus]|uniref:SMI1/KNR4 family protein n=1 Tax=Cerasicoccus maritimus TaxID=490089 RepID=UPI002852B4F4|nr:SMI1/KNR4 family protein [Cerasicoccus maritimus]
MNFKKYCYGKKVMKGFDKSESPITETQIEGAENLIGVSFPEEYKKVIREFNGAYGDVDFPIPGSEYGGSMGIWLSLSPWDRETIWSSLSAWNEHELSEKIIPFGEDGGGNWICFDYRENKEEPSIVYWFHEIGGDDGCIFVCDRFTTFLNSLTTPDDKPQEATSGNGEQAPHS